jgi:hypothetical protein
VADWQWQLPVKERYVGSNPTPGAMQFITESELNALKGLLHYLNTNMSPTDSEIGLNITVIDSNGEKLATVGYDEPGYVLRLG